MEYNFVPDLNINPNYPILPDLNIVYQNSPLQGISSMNNSPIQGIPLMDNCLFDLNSDPCIRSS